MSKKYQEIYDQLLQDIKNRIFENGEKLPSEAEMMETFDASRQTIRRTLSLLEQDGLIRKSRGSGSFVQFGHSSPNTRRIAVLFLDVNISVFPIMMQQIDTFLFQHGYTASFYSTNSSVQKERFILQQLINSPVDGVIMHAGTQRMNCSNIDLLMRLQEIGTKLVFFDSWYANLELSHIPVISVENFNGPSKITEYLLRHGHVRIGGYHVNGTINFDARFSGIHSALLRHDIPFDPDCFFAISDYDQAIYQASVIPPSLLHSLDAFICPSGILFAPLMELIKKHGCGNLRTIVVFDEVPVPNIEGLDFIIMKHASLETAQICAEKILELIDGKEVSSVQIPWILSENSTIKELPDGFGLQ